MPQEEFDISLDDEDLEWVRVRFITDNGRVVSFMVQYETVVDGERRPVVRYDSAHGIPHRDILSRSGSSDMRWVVGMSFGDAMTAGLHDIKAHWQRYRRQYFGDDE